MDRQILYDYIDRVEKEFNVDGEGWEFDSLVFWDQVSDVQEMTCLDTVSAYDIVCRRYSFLHISSEVLYWHNVSKQKDTP